MIRFENVSKVYKGDVVGFTIAEYLPRQVIAMRELLTGMPLLGGTASR